MPVFQDWNVYYPQRLNVGGAPVDICVHKMDGHKCPRCWMYTAKAEDELCERCWDVVMTLPSDEAEESIEARETLHSI